MFAPATADVNDGMSLRFVAATGEGQWREPLAVQPLAARERQPCTRPSMLNTASAIQIST